jgi:ABC-2 type transport system permease protein
MAVAQIRLFFICFKNAFHSELQQLFSGFTRHWLLWIFPFLIFTLISSIFTQGVMLDLPIGVVDHDHSSLSRQLIRELDAGSHAKLINDDMSLPEAIEQLKRINIYALLYIPPNFEADVLAGQQPTPILYYNSLYYSAGLYSIMDYSGLINSLNEHYRGIMATKIGLPIPTLAKVNFVYDGLFNATGNSRYFQLFSAIVHILQLFVVACTVHLLGQLPKTFQVNYAIILGKLFPYTLWYTSLLLLEIAVLVLASSAKVNSQPIFMPIVIFFYVMAAQSIGVLLFTFTRTVINAYSLIGILVGLALTYSGITVPEISMPLVAQLIAQIEPLTYAINTLFDIFLRHITFSSVVETCLILIIYPFITMILARKRFTKRLEQQEVFN